MTIKLDKKTERQLSQLIHYFEVDKNAVFKFLIDEAFKQVEQAKSTTH